MNATYGRFTVTEDRDEEGTYFTLRNEWAEELWTYETRREAVKEARRMALDERLDDEAMARGD